MILRINNDNIDNQYLSITDYVESNVFKTLKIDELKIESNVKLQLSIGFENIEINGIVKNIDSEIKEYNSTKGVIKIRNTIIDFK